MSRAANRKVAPLYRRATVRLSEGRRTKAHLIRSSRTRTQREAKRACEVRDERVPGTPSELFPASTPLRYLAPMVCLVPLGFWVATMFRTDEWGLLPVLAAGSLAAVRFTAAAAAKQTVVLDSVGIRWSTAFRSRAVSWDQVMSVALVNNVVSVTWSAGTAVLSIPARCREVIGPKVPVMEPTPAHFSPTLIASVRNAWIARRGAEDWTPPEPEPWVPSVEASGRVVLRRWALHPKWSIVSGFCGAMLGQTLFPI